MSEKTVFLKECFIDALKTGKLGSVDDEGIFFTVQEFKAVFSDIETDYINSFLPAATIEKGRTEMSHTKFVFRLYKGFYRVHPDLLANH